jgi:hypothetical protein
MAEFSFPSFLASVGQQLPWMLQQDLQRRQQDRQQGVSFAQTLAKSARDYGNVGPDVREDHLALLADMYPSADPSELARVYASQFPATVMHDPDADAAASWAPDDQRRYGPPVERISPHYDTASDPSAQWTYDPDFGQVRATWLNPLTGTREWIEGSENIAGKPDLDPRQYAHMMSTIQDRIPAGPERDAFIQNHCLTNNMNQEQCEEFRASVEGAEGEPPPTGVVPGVVQNIEDVITDITGKRIGIPPKVQLHHPLDIGPPAVPGTIDDLGDLTETTGPISRTSEEAFADHQIKRDIRIAEGKEPPPAADPSPPVGVNLSGDQQRHDFNLGGTPSVADVTGDIVNSLREMSSEPFLTGPFIKPLTDTGAALFTDPASLGRAAQAFLRDPLLPIEESLRGRRDTTTPPELLSNLREFGKAPAQFLEDILGKFGQGPHPYESFEVGDKPETVGRPPLEEDAQQGPMRPPVETTPTDTGTVSRRANEYDAFAQLAMRQRGLDTNVVGPLVNALIFRESSGKHLERPGKVKRGEAEEFGLMQVGEGATEDVERALGRQLDPSKLEDNVLIGVTYLSLQLNNDLVLQQGGWRAALAAYNAGETGIMGGWPTTTKKYVNDIESSLTPEQIRELDRLYGGRAQR